MNKETCSNLSNPLYPTLSSSLTSTLHTHVSLHRKMSSFSQQIRQHKRLMYKNRWTTSHWQQTKGDHRAEVGRQFIAIYLFLSTSKTPLLALILEDRLLSHIHQQTFSLIKSTPSGCYCFIQYICNIWVRPARTSEKLVLRVRTLIHNPKFNILQVSVSCSS